MDVSEIINDAETLLKKLYEARLEEIAREVRELKGIRRDVAKSEGVDLGETITALEMEQGVIEKKLNAMRLNFMA